MSFSTVMPFIFQWEGGYVNHPSDPGGETNFGITKKTYLEWCNKKGLSPKSMRALQKEDVLPIYKELYWDATKCDALSPSLSACVMDCAVNMGVGRATSFLSKTTDWRQYNQLRLSKYKEIIEKRPASKVFERGWNNRMADLSRFAESLHE